MRWWEIAAGCLFCVALAVCAQSLGERHRRLQRGIDAAKLRSERSESLTFGSLFGIDLSGQVFGSKFPEFIPRSVVCRLRTSSLSQDVDVLSEVSRLLPKDLAIRVVAYCDGSTCSQQLRSRESPLPFTVVTHGEVVATQALANADDLGECFLVDRRFRSVKTITWRKPGISPHDLAMEVAK
jgi:hypothetical protein